jgi:protein-S-isoprenylcysteine O-methyltransferase Ste14
MRRAGDVCFRFRGAVMGLLAMFAIAFGQPCSAGLLRGFGCLLLGESLRLWGVGYAGEPTRGERLDAPQLVTAGPYAYVRNPLYVGNMLNGLGVATAAFYPHQASCIVLCMLVVIAFYLFLGRHEETFLADLFGTEYDHYRRAVPAWLPRNGGYASPHGRFSWARSMRFERSTLCWLSLIWMVLVAKGWYT